MFIPMLIRRDASSSAPSWDINDRSIGKRPETTLLHHPLHIRDVADAAVDRSPHSDSDSDIRNMTLLEVVLGFLGLLLFTALVLYLCHMVHNKVERWMSQPKTPGPPPPYTPYPQNAPSPRAPGTRTEDQHTTSHSQRTARAVELETGIRRPPPVASGSQRSTHDDDRDDVALLGIDERRVEPGRRWILTRLGRGLPRHF